MTTIKMILIAAIGAAVTFALLLVACQSQLATKLPSGFGLIPFFLLFPAYVFGEVLGSRAAFLITGFLEFFLLWWVALLGWGWVHPGKQV